MKNRGAVANSILGAILDHVHIRVAETKMMSHLVDNNMADQFFQRDAGLPHFRQQRTAI